MGRGNIVQENIPQDKKAEPWTPAEGFDWARLDFQSACFHAVSTHRTTFSHNHETENIDALKRKEPQQHENEKGPFMFVVFKWGYQLHRIILSNVVIKNPQSLKICGLLTIIPMLQHNLSFFFILRAWRQRSFALHFPVLTLLQHFYVKLFFPFYFYKTSKSE